VFAAGKPVGVICHGPWTLVEADVVRNRTLTSWPSLRTDLTNAGATWVDEEVARCERGPNVLVTSRRPGDLPAFGKAFTEVFGAGV
jgi:protease I